MVLEWFKKEAWEPSTYKLMSKLENFIYKDGERFYFDTENYNDEIPYSLAIQYEDGDTIIWDWENKKMSGVLRKISFDDDLFVIDKVNVI